MEGGVYVNDKLFNKEGHLTKETLDALKLDILNNGELLSILDHISDCEKCAGAFADNFNDNELAKAPLGFEETVELKIKDKKQSATHFNFYCFKVAATVCIALLMVFSNGLNFLANEKADHIKPIDLNILDSVNSNLNNFSEKIIKLEVFNNEKEKE